MTPEEKELVIKDLSGRLPYGVRCSYPYGVDTLQSIDLEDMSFTFDCPIDDNYYEIDGIRPYLRPMSSMTKEEHEEYHKTFRVEAYGHGYVYVESVHSFDWLNAHHFDYRGLIPAGLANAAPEGMYNS